MKKTGRPSKKQQTETIVVEQTEQTKKSTQIVFGEWMLTGTGNFAELDELLAQLRGVK